MSKVDTMSLCSTVDLINLCPFLFLKVVSTQELVERIPPILFVVVVVADCEGRPVIIGLIRPLSFGLTYCYNLHYVLWFSSNVCIPRPMELDRLLAP